MVRQLKNVLVLTLAIALGCCCFMPADPVHAAEPNGPGDSRGGVLDQASKSSLELLRRGSAKAQPDWRIVATAGVGRWAFITSDMREKTVALPTSTETNSAASGGLPPLTDLVVPLGGRVIVDVTSNDAFHPFVVPGLGIGAYAIPGRLTRLSINTTNPGAFPSTCAAPCSGGAKDMAFAIHVVDADVFKRWLDAKESAFAKPTLR
jgi:heme/copper-type cytochrome/quinol oxidase subunit 2